MKRRGVIAAPFVLAALAAPSRDWLLATLDGAAGERGPRRVDMKQVAAIREMFSLFQEMDVMRGGGHARVALVEYMNSYVLPLVKYRHSEPIQRALYEAGSEQAYLVGWMAYDDGQYMLSGISSSHCGWPRPLGTPPSEPMCLPECRTRRISSATRKKHSCLPGLANVASRSTTRPRAWLISKSWRLGHSAR